MSNKIEILLFSFNPLTMVLLYPENLFYPEAPAFSSILLKKKIILILVKDAKEDFIQGTSAVVFYGWEEGRLGSTLNAAWTSSDL